MFDHTADTREMRVVPRAVGAASFPALRPMLDEESGPRSKFASSPYIDADCEPADYEPQLDVESTWALALVLTAACGVVLAAIVCVLLFGIPF